MWLGLGLTKGDAKYGERKDVARLRGEARRGEASNETRMASAAERPSQGSKGTSDLGGPRIRPSWSGSFQKWVLALWSSARDARGGTAVSWRPFTPFGVGLGGNLARPDG